MVGIFRDNTDRKQAACALVRMNRMLRALSSVNAAVIRATSEQQLLQDVCRIIVEVGGHLWTWIGIAEQGQAKTIRPIAQFGREAGYPLESAFSWADAELDSGPAGTAIQTGTVQTNRKFLTAPAMAPWREAALKRGFQSYIALPLKNSTDIWGALTIYASDPDAFNEEEVTLLRELVNVLAFGIEALRTRAERDRNLDEHIHHEELLRKNFEDSIQAIAHILEMRDRYTAGHQLRVSQLSFAIATELGLPEDTIHGIKLAASVHDIGKISVPAEILSKPGVLTDLEMKLVQNHAQAGYDILKDIQFPWPLATIVWQHHEKLDGSGYPQGLKGDQILLGSRILTVADVVEAMASHRPYRAALGIDAALKELKRGRSSIYDAAVVDACLKLFREKRFAFQWDGFYQKLGVVY